MRVAVGALVLSLAAGTVGAVGPAVSGGLDVRGQAGSEDSELALKGVFLNVRQVFTQGGADRYVAVLQGDSGDNFEHPRFYQTYLQVKGPLGRWNVLGGRFIVPFGLLSSHDSERLVLNTIEPLTLGLKLDEGVQLSGYTAAFEYAAAVTNGVDGHAVGMARLGFGDDDLSFGVSLLAGTLPETTSKESLELVDQVLDGVPLVRKRRLGLDATLAAGPDLWRGELVGGTDEGTAVGGGYLEWERALDAHWSLNANAGYWHGAGDLSTLGLGVTRNLGGGHYLRAAGIHEDIEEGRGDALVVQYYFEFSRQL